MMSYIENSGLDYRLTLNSWHEEATEDITLRDKTKDIWKSNLEGRGTKSGMTVKQLTQDDFIYSMWYIHFLKAFANSYQTESFEMPSRHVQ